MKEKKFNIQHNDVLRTKLLDSTNTQNTCYSHPVSLSNEIIPTFRQLRFLNNTNQQLSIRKEEPTDTKINQRNNISTCNFQLEPIPTFNLTDISTSIKNEFKHNTKISFISNETSRSYIDTEYPKGKLSISTPNDRITRCTHSH